MSLTSHNTLVTSLRHQHTYWSSHPVATMEKHNSDPTWLAIFRVKNLYRHTVGIESLLILMKKYSEIQLCYTIHKWHLLWFNVFLFKKSIFLCYQCWFVVCVMVWEVSPGLYEVDASADLDWTVQTLLHKSVLTSSKWSLCYLKTA